ncbi:MAG: DUF3667 domain-containing protein [Ginsengibacter sp.]
MPNCLNCGTLITQNFCPKCGQKRDVGKLTWRSLLNEIFHFFSHIEKGFMYTSYRLLIRPDKLIGEYLEGKRKKYFKPLSLYLIWVTVHLLAYQLVTGWMHYENFRTGNFIVNGGETGTYILQHTNLFGLLLLPILSFCLWLIVSRPKLNYIENFVALIYAFAATEILIFCQIIITGLLFKTNFLTNNFFIQVQVVTFIWTFYFAVVFLKTKKIKFLIPRILLAEFIGIVLYAKVSGLIAGLILKMTL